MASIVQCTVQAGQSRRTTNESHRGRDRGAGAQKDHMWIVKLALNRPYTFIVFALLLFLAAPVVLLQTPVDIFPEINIPVVSIIWTYTGLVPKEMETRITSIYERALTTTVGNVDHIESQSLNGVSVIKLYLQPQANVEGAIAEVDAEAQATM